MIANNQVMAIFSRAANTMKRNLLFLLLFFSSLSANAAISTVDRIIAVVNDDVILESELVTRLKAVENQLQQRGTKIPSEDVLRRQVLERLIISHLQIQAAERGGIRIDDKTLNASINRVAKQNNMTLEQFRSALENDGIDYSVFREDIRKEMIISRLMQRRIQQRVNITEQEIDNFLSTNKSSNEENKEYRLSHILISLPEAASAEQVEAAQAKANAAIKELRLGTPFNQVAASSSDGQKAFEGGDLGWRKVAQLPSIFADVANKMQKNDVSDPIRSPSGFHIIKLSDIRGAKRRHLVKQTLARHILIRRNELTSNEDAKTRLQQLLIRLEGGEDFSSLARAHSDDRGSAARGGDLGWSNPGALVPKFETEMNKLAPGQISQPFQTQFGWHIVQTLERREHDDTDSFIRSKARKFIRDRKTEDESQAWIRRIRDEAFVEYRLDDI